MLFQLNDFIIMKTDREEYKFAGIPTFMRSPYVGIDQLDEYDVGVIGVPVDYGVSYREGAKYGPRSIREHSHWDRVTREQFHDLETGQTIVSQSLKLADVGDVHISPGDPEKTNNDISRAVEEIRQRVFPLILGGDHSITYAAFRGCVKALPDDQKPVGVLHFDGHPDVEKSYLTLPRVWHGNPFRVLMEEGHLDGKNMVTIGPRGLMPQKWMDYIREQGVTLFSTPEIRRQGLPNVIQKTIAHLRERCVAVYISFDIDCIDPAHAAGTGTPSIGGLRAEEIMPVMRKLSELPVVGFDLTEVNPVLDPSGLTSIVSSDLLWNFLSFGLKPKHKKS